MLRILHIMSCILVCIFPQKVGALPDPSGKAPTGGVQIAHRGGRFAGPTHDGYRDNFGPPLALLAPNFRNVRN